MLGANCLGLRSFGVRKYRIWRAIPILFSLWPSYLTASSCDTTIRLWDANTGEIYQTIEGHFNCIRSMAFLPDTSGSDDKIVRLWDTTIGELY
ncbi:WD40 repeat-like protein [Penicillium psychrosexuale]|uniref:WD40 repeat-like protein n=1 Tax=Penicillium psychrosexuale TaxID=1002107 RepID=UPI002545728B|nr:WD40 repeat-like protein [Penicillium psychrosexuale]KAJ5796217.1 WD40 repeat-like protein [Penicillium psychrosexuale]